MGILDIHDPIGNESISNTLDDHDPRNKQSISGEHTFLEILEEECEKSEIKYEKDLKFDHEPQTIENFCLHKDYLAIKDEIRPWVLDTLNEVCEDWEIYKPKYNRFILSCAIGIGKSYLAGILTAYQAHLLYCLKNPQKYFGLGRGSKLLIINNSTSAKQARKGIYGYAQARIIYSPWFRKYMPWNDRIQSELQFDIFPEDMSNLDPDKIYKNIYIMPGNSNPDSGVGFDLFGGYIDEASKLGRDSEGVDIASKNWDVMSRRITSRFCNEDTGEINGFLMMLGSPNFSDDFLEQKFSTAKNDDKLSNTYCKRITKWEASRKKYVGPTFFFNFKKLEIVDIDKVTVDTIEIPDLPAYRQDFEENPAGALRDHAAMPTDTIAPFFSNFEIVKQSINRFWNEEERKFEYKERQDPMNINNLGYQTPNDINFDILKPYYCYYNVIHIDLAYNFDNLGFSMCTLKDFDNDGSPIVIQDLVFYLKGTSVEPIQFKDVREFIYELSNNGWRIDCVSLDGFQSLDMMQILEDRGYKTRKISVDVNKKPYTNLKEGFNGKRICLYHNEKMKNTPSNLQFLELKKLEDRRKKIDHPQRGSKDLSDSLCGAYESILLAIEEGEISDSPQLKIDEDDSEYEDCLII